jgi:hypothetical protein
MIQGLRGMFENQERAERYNISKSLFACKMAEGSLVNPHVIKMMGYIETLDKLGYELKDELATDVILQSIPVSYEPFIMNFHINDMEKIVAEFKIAEDNIKKNHNHMMMVQKEKKKRKHSTPPEGKCKEKVFDEPSSSKPKTEGKSGPSPDEECFHYHKKGHWFRNCKKYLEEQQQKKGSDTSTSGINIIEINVPVCSSDSCVFDTGSMIHTCKSLQGLSLTRRFAKGELDIHVGNGAKVVAITVDTFHLPLPLRLVLELNNYYYIPALCKSIISSSYLEEVDDYEIIIKNKHCSIYYNGIFYAYCPLVNGLYVLDLEDKSICNINTKLARLNDLNPTVLDLEDKSICNINTKRARLNDLSPTFIWHCRLGHIIEKALRDSIRMVCSTHLILNHLTLVCLVYLGK